MGFAGCGHRGVSENGGQEIAAGDTITDLEELDEDNDFSDDDAFYYDRETLELVTNSIVGGDKETFASLVQYPVRREYPLRYILNKKEMVESFDRIFDKDFRTKLRSLGLKAWDLMGWRGFMLLDGDIWCDGTEIIAINYVSPRERKTIEKFLERDRQSLHPSLQGPWRPVEIFVAKEGPYGTVRIDTDTTQCQSHYRLVLFERDAPAGAAPALCLDGNIEALKWTRTIYFSGGNGYKASYTEYSEEGDPLSPPQLFLSNPDGTELVITGDLNSERF